MGETTARLRSKGGNSSSISSSSSERRLSLSGEDPSAAVSEPTTGQQLEGMVFNSESSSSSNSWRNYSHRQRRVWLIRFAAVLLSAVVVVVVVVVVGLAFSTRSSTSFGNAQQKLAPPLRGQAYLSPDEFLDIRESHGYESVLVTGGLGFIGSHVVDLLLHRGFHVTILDDESNGHNHNPEAFEWVPRDVSVMTDLPPYPKIMKMNGREGNVAATTTATNVLLNYNSVNQNHQRQREDGVQERNESDDNYYTHVIHLAAAISVSESMTNPDKYERINYEGSQNLLDWIHGYNQHVLTSASTTNSTTATTSTTTSLSSSSGPTTIRRVVAASSAAIYGDPHPDLLPLQESAPYGGLSPYADTKYRMEGLMRDFVIRQNNNEERLGSSSTSAGAAAPPPQTTAAAASAVALRFFNVYGPRQDPKNPYSGVISLFLDMAATGRDITILGDGQMTRDFVYVKDVARAIVLALLQDDDKELADNDKGRKKRTEEATFDVYNVCTGKSITINTLAERVRQSMKSSSAITHLDPREGDIRESSCDPTGAEEGIGFRSAVSQESGLEKTAAWFRIEQQQQQQQKLKM